MRSSASQLIFRGSGNTYGLGISRYAQGKQVEIYTKNNLFVQNKCTLFENLFSYELWCLRKADCPV